MRSCSNPVKVANGVFLPCVRIEKHQGKCLPSYTTTAIYSERKRSIWGRLRRRAA